MQPAGWYPDPSGVPRQFRFWDGQTWTAAVTMDPNAPFPSPQSLQGGPAAPGTQPLGSQGGAGHGGVGQAGTGQGVGPGAGGPGQSFSGPGRGSTRQRSPLPLIIGAAVVALVLVVGGLIFFLRPGDDQRADPAETPPATQPAPPPPSANPSEQGPVEGGDGPIQCTLGNGSAMPVEQGLDTETAGLIFPIPEDFDIRLDVSQFPYLNDVVAYGPTPIGSSAVIAGGLPREAGFGDQERASRDIYECIPSGFEPGSFEGFDVGETIKTTVGPHDAFLTTATATSEGSTVLWNAYTIDTGQQGVWATMITFAAEDDQAAQDELIGVVESVK